MTVILPIQPRSKELAKAADQIAAVVYGPKFAATPISVNKKEFEISQGDYFRIPENTYHALKVTSKEPIKVLSVQSPEFLGKDRVFEDEH